MEFIPPVDRETPPTFDMLATAASYSRRTWRIIPLHSITADGRCTCGNERCSSPGKHPRTKNGVKDATNDRETVLAWWQRDPNANIGIATGKGLLVIDIDPRHGGNPQALDDRFNLPETAQVSTGGGGWHLYYSYNQFKYTLPNTAGKLGEGIDSRGENGYVVAPPSRHASGNYYTWNQLRQLAHAPVSLLQELLKPRPALYVVGAAPSPAPVAETQAEPSAIPEAQGATAPVVTAGRAGIPEGRRNTTLFQCASLLRREGADEQMLSILLGSLNTWMCRPPLPEEEVRKLCANVARCTPGACLTGDLRQDLEKREKLKLLMSSKVPEPQWAVPGFLPEGVTLLAGKPKMGKSWLALDLALAVSRGGLALGSLPTKAGQVFYLALEDSRYRMYDRVARLLGQLPVPEDFTWAGSWTSLQAGGLVSLEACLQEEPQMRLVVIDTLARVRSASTGQVYADDYAALTPLKQLAEQYHVAILLVHHLRKSGATDPMDEVSGTTGLTGAADCIMVLQRERGQRLATLTITGRDVRDQALSLTFDEATAHWSIKQSREPRPLSPDRQAILALLQREARPLSPKEMAQALDKSSSYVSKTTHYMVKQGLLQVVQRGLYELVPEDEREGSENGGKDGKDTIDQPVELLEAFTEE